MLLLIHPALWYVIAQNLLLLSTEVNAGPVIAKKLEEFEPTNRKNDLHLASLKRLEGLLENKENFIEELNHSTKEKTDDKNSDRLKQKEINDGEKYKDELNRASEERNKDEHSNDRLKEKKDKTKYLDELVTNWKNNKEDESANEVDSLSRKSGENPDFGDSPKSAANEQFNALNQLSENRERESNVLHQATDKESNVSEHDWSIKKDTDDRIFSDLNHLTKELRLNGHSNKSNHQSSRNGREDTVHRTTEKNEGNGTDGLDCSSGKNSENHIFRNSNHKPEETGSNKHSSESSQSLKNGKDSQTEEKEENKTKKYDRVKDGNEIHFDALNRVSKEVDKSNHSGELSRLMKKIDDHSNELNRAAGKNRRKYSEVSRFLDSSVLSLTTKVKDSGGSPDLTKNENGINNASELGRVMRRFRESKEPDEVSSLTKKANENETSSVFGSLGSVIASASNAVKDAVSSIDKAANRAVGGVGFALGVVGGLAANVGTKTFNSLVKIQNTKIENFQKLKQMTAKIGYSTIDLGSTVIAETANVLDSVRRENCKVVKKSLGQIPILRSVVTLAEILKSIPIKGMRAMAKGMKHMGGLAVTTANFEKAKPLEEPSFLNGMGSTSPAVIASLMNTVGANGEQMMEHLIGSENIDETFDKGHYIGLSAGPVKMFKTVTSGNPTHILS